MIKIRFLVVVVAAAAVIAWGLVMWQRSKFYSHLAIEHEFAEQLHKSALNLGSFPVIFVPDDYSKRTKEQVFLSLRKNREDRRAHKSGMRPGRYFTADDFSELTKEEVLVAKEMLRERELGRKYREAARHPWLRIDTNDCVELR